MRALVLFMAVVLCITHIVFATGHPESASELPDKSSSSSSEFISPVKSKSSTNNADSSPKKASTSVFSKSPLENIPSQLANVRENLRQGAYKAVGVLYKTAHPVRQDIQRQVHNTAGALYETGAPLRKSLADNKRVKMGGIALKIYKQLELKGKTREDKVKVVVDALSEELVKHVPLYTKIQPIEIIGMSKYICGVKGLMKDLTTMEHVDTNIKVIHDDWLEIKIDYTFSDLHFNFTKFHIHALGIASFKVDGWLDIKCNKNNVRITLQIPKFTEMITHLALKRCIVYVTNFEVTELQFDKSTLSGRKNSNRRKILSGRIKEFLAGNPEFLRADFERKTLEEIHRALVTRGHWVCKDDGFGELVKSKGGSLDDFVPQDREQFAEHCGNDYFIEPYVKPRVVEEPDSSS